MTYRNNSKIVALYIFIYLTLSMFLEPILSAKHSELNLLSTSNLIINLALLPVLPFMFSHFKKVNLKPLNFDSKFKYFMLPVVIFYILYELDGVVGHFIGVYETLTIKETIAIIILAICGGINEEIIFRGFLLTALLKYFRGKRFRITYSVLLQALLFGLAHIPNYLSGTQSLSATFQQALSASITGVILGFIYVITNRLYPVIIIHILKDVQPSMASGFVTANPWGVILTFAIVTLIIFGVLLVNIDIRQKAKVS